MLDGLQDADTAVLQKAKDLRAAMEPAAEGAAAAAQKALGSQGRDAPPSKRSYRNRKLEKQPSRSCARSNAATRGLTSCVTPGAYNL